MVDFLMPFLPPIDFFNISLYTIIYKGGYIIFKLLRDKIYTDEERDMINYELLESTFNEDSNDIPKINHCTNPNCIFYSEDAIQNLTEEYCPVCGAYTTYLYYNEYKD